jgi:structural maintenance of chromosomes protein 5
MSISPGRGPTTTEQVHQPGAIVRLRLRNFVTYSSVEFKCGPSLNMIIGPNGTGKSTIVCAICLGLGWPPSLLGRAKEVHDYVKNGTKEAEIEIELQAGPAYRGRNPIIRRAIRREGNKSSFWINGTTATKTEVQELVKKLHIQIDNLCQFLPQDRVVEFARMSPVQLLEETERAVGTKELCDWHEKLKVLGKEAQNQQTEIESTEARLASLHERQDQQRGDVERLHERENLQAKHKSLQKVRPAVKYAAVKEEVEALKIQERTAKAEHEQLQRDLDPDTFEIDMLNEYRHDVDTAHTNRRAVVVNLQTTLGNLRSELDDKKDSIGGHRRRIEADANKRTNCDKKITLLSKELASTEQRLGAGRPRRDFADLNDQKRHHAQAIKQLKENQEEPQSLMEGLLHKLSADKKAKTALVKQKEALKTREGQQLSKLQRLSADTHDAWNWIEKNKERFQARVYGPAIITCSLKQSNLASHLTTLLQPQDYTAFTVTNRADYQTLHKNLYGTLRLSNVAIRTVTQTLSEKRAPFNQAILDRYGFQSWAIDALEGPDPVLAMLCDNQNLHRTPIQLGQLTKGQEDAVRRSQITQYISADTCFAIRRRAEYGDAGISTSIRNLRPDIGYWTHGSSEGNSDSGLDKQIQDLESVITSGLKETEKHRDTLRKLQGDIKSLEAEMVRYNIILRIQTYLTSRL